MDKTKLLKLSITELIKAFELGQTSSEEATKACLEKIKNSQLNAVVHINEDAMNLAKEADKKRREGKKGRLLGVPILLKANMCTKDNMPTSCCSNFLKDFKSPYNATVVEKLLKEGAVIIGKANMDEFAMGASNETSAFAKAKNPHDLTRIPGGSSGGSAAAVAGLECYASLGSDTGGSIRQPSALCGVVGLKPTYGSVSRRGLVAFASSLDQIGPITRTVEDNALLYEIIMGEDEKDSTTNRKPEKFVQNIGAPIKGLTLGLAKEYLDLPADSEVKQTVLNTIDFYKKNGVKVVEVSLPNIDKALAVYYILSSAEAASNLSRFDGIRYGKRVEGKDLIDTYYKSRTAGFGAEVKRRIMLGNYVLSSGFYDAYYKKATKVQQVLKQEFENAFLKCDCLIAPVCPQVAWHFGERSTPISNYMADIFTVPVNIVGRPAISFPCGVNKDNMPIGVQLIADMNREDVLYKLASYFEKHKGVK